MTKTLGDIAAEIRAIAGVTADERDTRERFKIRNAARHSQAVTDDESAQCSTLNSRNASDEEPPQRAEDGGAA